MTVLSSHYTYHAFGYPILKALLSPQWMRHLNSYLGGSHNDLIMAALKVLNAMTAFASGKEQKALFEAFAWETKVRCFIIAIPCSLNLYSVIAETFLHEAEGKN